MQINLDIMQIKALINCVNLGNDIMEKKPAEFKNVLKVTKEALKELEGAEFDYEDHIRGDAEEMAKDNYLDR